VTDESKVSVLPDLLRPGLKLVIVGTAAGEASAIKGFYYAGRGNRFWRVLHEVGLTATELGPKDCERLLHYGIGLTDLAKDVSGMDAELPADCFDTVRLRRMIERLSPGVVAFNGKKAAAIFFGIKKSSKLEYGRQRDRIGGTAIYICPSTSAAAKAHWSQKPWLDLARDVVRVSAAR
jgi:double-stranded uracil-DNA glycosylase